MKLFDYIYYRIYVFFLARKDNVPETTGWILLSLLVFATFVSVIFLMSLVFYHSIPSKWHFAPILILIGLLGWYRYERDFDIEKYTSQWGDEPLIRKRKKGWLIVVWFVVVFLIPISIGVLRHNLGLIN